MRARGYLVLFTLALIWGASYLFIKIALDNGVPPATLVVIRLSFSVATLGAIALARPKLLAGWRRYWRLAILVGFINIAVPYSLISWSETQIASGTAAILNATTPLFTVLLAGVWLGSAHESLSLRRVIGVLIGFAGVGVLVGPEAFALGGQSVGVAQAELAVVVAAAAYAIGALLSRRFGGSAMLVGPLCTQIAALLWVIPLAADMESAGGRPATPGAGRAGRARHSGDGYRLPALLLADPQRRCDGDLDGDVSAPLHGADLGRGLPGRAALVDATGDTGARALRLDAHERDIQRAVSSASQAREGRRAGRCGNGCRAGCDGQ